MKLILFHFVKKRQTLHNLRGSVQFSRSVMSNFLRPHGLQLTRFPRPSPSPGACSNSCPLSQWCYPTISSSVTPFSFCPPSLPASVSFPLFQWVGSFDQVAKVLELPLQHQSFQWIFRTDFPQDWFVWSACSPRDSQESSPATEFASINSSVLSLLSCPTLTFLHDYWKNHIFDYMDLCLQSDVSAF